MFSGMRNSFLLSVCCIFKTSGGLQHLKLHEKLTNDSYKYVLFCSSLRVLTSIYSNILYIHRVGQCHSCLLGSSATIITVAVRPTVDPLSDHPDLVDWVATLDVVLSRSDFPVVDNERLDFIMIVYITTAQK